MRLFQNPVDFETASNNRQKFRRFDVLRFYVRKHASFG
jgi:hypothetical protein